jgi:hypothetical protein
VSRGWSSPASGWATPASDRAAPSRPGVDDLARCGVGRSLDSEPETKVGACCCMTT